MVGIVRAGAGLPFASVGLDPPWSILAGLRQRGWGARDGAGAGVRCLRRVRAGLAQTRTTRKPAPGGGRGREVRQRPTLSCQEARPGHPPRRRSGWLRPWRCGDIAGWASSRSTSRTARPGSSCSTSARATRSSWRARGAAGCSWTRGPDPDRLLVALDERLPPWDHRLDVVVITHPHEDHVAGLALLLERYRIGRVLEPGMIGPGPGHAAAERRSWRRGSATEPWPPAIGSRSTTWRSASSGRIRAECHSGRQTPARASTTCRSCCWGRWTAGRSSSPAMPSRPWTRTSWRAGCPMSTCSRWPTTGAPPPPPMRSSTPSGHRWRSSRSERATRTGTRPHPPSSDCGPTAPGSSERTFRGRSRWRSATGAWWRAPAGGRRSPTATLPPPRSRPGPLRPPSRTMARPAGPAVPGRRRGSCTIGQMTVPGRADAASLLLSLDPPPWFVRHARAVAEVSGWLAAQFAGRGIPVDRGLVEAAALLHDVDKLLPAGDPARRLPHGEGSAAWLARRGPCGAGPCGRRPPGHPPCGSRAPSGLAGRGPSRGADRGLCRQAGRTAS